MTASDKNLGVTAAILERLIFLNPDQLEEGVVQLECNACDEDDYVFYTGDGSLLTTSGWISKAVIHGYKHHKARMEGLLTY